MFGVKQYLCIFAVLFNIKSIFIIMEERKLYCEVPSVESLMCLLGLNFPESATEFQKAVLTLAHLYACIRDYVLKGVEVPNPLLEVANMLNTIQYYERFKQR